MNKRAIAIDGPAGAGKSSLARALARELGFVYIDTGAIYRSLGLFVEKCGRSPAKAADVLASLPDCHIRLMHGTDGLQRMFLGEEDVTEEIRENRVSTYASQVSALPEVRTFLLAMQRALASEHNVVMDGRDIGTVVLPEAQLKIFLTASPERRAQRRHLELSQKGEAPTLETILEEIMARDRADRERAVAPLRQAKDAILFDTSELNLQESLAALLSLAKEQLAL